MNKIIIIAEDEKSIAKILKEKISELSSDIEVEVYFNGSIALENILNKKPYLILLDLLLPGKLGIDILKEIRATEELKDTKVIILSNLSDQEHIKASFSLGISGYLVKVDHTLEEVVEVVKKLL